MTSKIYNVNPGLAKNVVIQPALFFSGNEKRGSRKASSPVRYWAERGLIRAEWEDAQGRERFKTYDLKSFTLRVKGLSQMISRKDKTWYPDEVKKLQDFVDQSIEMIKRVIKEQGNPQDKRVFQDKINHGGVGVPVYMGGNGAGQRGPTEGSSGLPAEITNPRYPVESTMSKYIANRRQVTTPKKR